MGKNDVHSYVLGEKVNNFTLKDQDGVDFSLEKNKAAHWTVLYFYPKADTPGCTKQACAFRDSLEQIRNLNAQIYGVSTDKVENLKKFKEKYNLNFTLLSDVDGELSKLFETKMPLVNISKRNTFLIDPDLVLRHIDRDVDPVMDAQKIAKKLEELGAKKQTK